MSDITVGVDIGTTSVKAIAADGEGAVVGRARVPHAIHVPAPDLFHHDPDAAWRRGVVAALREASAGHDVRAVNVAAMVPSLAAFDEAGSALTPGLLYGDARGRSPDRKPGEAGDVGEFAGFLRWCAGEAPDAAGYWNAQAAANHALSGEAVMDFTAAMTTTPLYTLSGWDTELLDDIGVPADELPVVATDLGPVGRVADLGDAVLGPGSIDAYAEQLVAGADEDGDVLVILGTTLIVWAVIPEWIERPGLWTIPHTAPDKILIGGPSNAGGLFINWALGLLGEAAGEVDPARVPVWTPYVRGERVPYHDPDRRGVLHDLDLTHGPAALRRSVFEASGFVVRHLCDLGEAEPRRVVATGGGTRVDEWVQALADCTGLPVDVVAVPEGAALGTAFLARQAAGLEAHSTDAARWARTARTVDPDRAWEGPVAERYERYRSLADADGR